MNERRQEITNLLKAKKLECLICLLPVTKGTQACSNCFKVYHFKCIKKWTQTRQNCPNCLRFMEPKDTCFCGKGQDASCGQTCAVIMDCKHKCLLKCHPGPHDCAFSGRIYCGCSRYSVVERCGQTGNVTINEHGKEITLTRMIDGTLQCNEVCSKKLSCLHQCENICCTKCFCKVSNQCYCGKQVKVGSCSIPFSCNNDCGFVYSCGHSICFLTSMFKDL